MGEPIEQRDSDPRLPSLADSVAPVVVLVALLTLTIALSGIDATEGPLQVALLLGAAFASLVAFKNGHTVATIRIGTVGGVCRRWRRSSSCWPSAR
jgi:NhaC family Na+:H+ antiporter